MTDEFHVKGGAALDYFLQQLPVRLEKNIMRSALRAGASVILPVARSNIHSVSGELAASLNISTRGRAGTVTASVQTRDFRARFVEYGTKPHTITATTGKALAIGGLFFRSVHHPGTLPGHPYLRTALDTEAGAALAAVAGKISERLTAEGIVTPDASAQGDE